MKRNLGAFLAGLLFGAGLAISGLVQPSKIFGFLDVSGAFDASLLVAMTAGIAVLRVAQRIARRAGAPLFAEQFPIYYRTKVDGRSLGGAALFGVGWALAGMCPGPALASFAFGVPAALWFVPAMAAGMLAFAAWEAASRKRNGKEGRRSPRELPQNVARLAQLVAPSRRDSPLPGTEHVRGFGVPALSFSSGHVLALRVFAQSDFGPYRSLWHRDARGAWSIYVDGAAVDEACPRYFGAALRSSRQARIRIDWCGPAELRVRMDDPPLDWTLTIASSPILMAMNVVLAKMSDTLWRRPEVPRMFERLSKHFLGDADMLAKTPNGHLHLLAPQRMFLIAASQATMSGEDFGDPIRARENPRIGSWRLPARPIFAMGRGFFEPEAAAPSPR